MDILIAVAALTIAVLSFVVNFVYTYYTRQQFIYQTRPTIDITPQIEGKSAIRITVKNLHSATSIATFSILASLYDTTGTLIHEYKPQTRGSITPLQEHDVEYATPTLEKIFKAHFDSLELETRSIIYKAIYRTGSDTKRTYFVFPEGWSFSLSVQVSYQSGIPKMQQQITSVDYIVLSTPQSTSQEWKVTKVI